MYYWSRPLSGCAVIQLACLACRAVTLIPVAWPGRAATPQDVAGFSDLHQGLTVATVCGSWTFGVFPGAGLLVFFDVDVNTPPWAAVFFSGTALMAACVASLDVEQRQVDVRFRTARREAAAPHATGSPPM